MSTKFRVGIVVTLGIGLLTAILFLVGNRTLLFSDQFQLRSQFNSVAGLSVGANVQFQGVSIGAVESVALPSEPGGKIEITMRIRSSARSILHKNTQAEIKTQGLLGSMIVVLTNPPISLNGLTPLDNDDLIVGIDPFDLFEITDKALASVQRFEESATSFERIIDDIRAGEGTLGKLVYDPELYNSMVSTAQETERLMANLGDDAEALVMLATQATEGVESILGKLDQGDGTFAQLLNEADLYESVQASADTLQQVIIGVGQLTQRIEAMMDWASLGAFRFAELMEAGKHNWLFKRYFEERGYMEQAPFEIRERAIAESFDMLQSRELELLALEDQLQRKAAMLDSLQQQLNR
ncbi:MAG: MlaD family protein [Bacteroidetes bacterium]|nr:MlaD family protein [Bacteroidota bacterium]MCY4232779.1 MlaD family protein [Bacteroidota bacterium]